MKKANIFKMQGTGGCGSCTDAQTPDFPDYLLAATPRRVMQGGIAGFVVMTSSVAWTLITAQAEWVSKIASGDIRGRLNGCRIKGSAGASEKTTRARGACGAQETVKSTKTWTITDVENDDLYSNHDFYEWLRVNGQCVRWAFITCDYELIGYDPVTDKFMAAVNVDPDNIIPETNEDDSSIQLVVQTVNPGLIKPVRLAFLETLAPTLNGE